MKAVEVDSFLRSKVLEPSIEVFSNSDSFINNESLGLM